MDHAIAASPKRSRQLEIRKKEDGEIFTHGYILKLASDGRANLRDVVIERHSAQPNSFVIGSPSSATLKGRRDGEKISFFNGKPNA